MNYTQASDNCSTDGTQEIIQRDFPEVRFVQSDSNSGFGAGNNLGIKMALEDNANYLFLLNQDAWIDEKTIEELFKEAEKNRDFGILSPIHFNGSGELLDKRFLFHLASDNRKLFTDLMRKKTKPLYEVDFVNAAAWLINVSCIKKVGYFDPVFHHYGEDENFIHRCSYFGYKTGILIDSHIWHDREIVTAKKEEDTAFDLKLMKISWIVKMTNINYKDWLSNYNKDLLNLCRKNFVKIKVIQKERA